VPWPLSYHFPIFIMAIQPTTSQAPRSPNDEELKQLAGWLQSLGAYDEEFATITASTAYVAVFDHYQTGCPGYCGKLLAVVWDGSPSTYDVFVWSNGNIEHVDRQ